MEYRLYNKPNCSFFDLITGNHETKQTKGLGLLLSKSPVIMESLLKLISDKLKNNPHYNLNKLEYIVDCEKSAPQGNTSGRADIVLRFFSSNAPKFAIVLEAKSIQSGYHQGNVLCQAINYANSLPQLKVFGNNIYVGTITLFLSIHNSTCNNSFHLSWMEIIKMLETSSKKVHGQFEREQICDFSQFLIKTNKLMKNYSVEITSIPAGNSIPAINDPLCGIYECPYNNKYSKYSKQKPLYIAFREKGGIITTLYKLAGIEVLDMNDSVVITTIDAEGKYPNFANRIAKYKTHIPSVSGIKQVFVLDLVNSIHLPYKVKYMNRTPQGLAYHDLKEFFPTQICQSVVLLQKKP